MSDIRLWRKDFIIGLIQIYKSHTCLWKIKSQGYKNKKLKENAYNALVKYCKDNGIHEANRDFVANKIQSLRGSFRKEMKRIKDSQCSGKSRDENHKPNLWYYNLLLFTKDQEVATDTTSVSYTDEQYEEAFIKEEIQSTSTNNDDQEIQSEQTEFESMSSAPLTKRKRSNSEPDFLKICTDLIKTNTKEVSEFDAVGINTAKKLAKMDSLQAIYAESLINNVIRQGLLRKLTKDTSLCEGCSLSSAHTCAPSFDDTPKPLVKCKTNENVNRGHIDC